MSLQVTCEQSLHLIILEIFTYNKQILQRLSVNLIKLPLLVI